MGPVKQGKDGTSGRTGSFLKEMVVAAGMVLLLLLIWSTAQIFFLIFAGVLLAIFLRSLSHWVDDHTPLGSGGSLAVVIFALLGLFGLGGWYLAPDIAEQADALFQSLPRMIHHLEAQIDQYEWGRRILAQAPKAAERFTRPFDILSRVTGVFSTALGMAMNFIIVFFLGLYLAIDPGRYRTGLIQLAPIDRRDRTEQVLNQLGDTLQWWLIGRMVAMVVIGLLTAVGLWLIGVPLALMLGLSAGILSFIPYLGPILSIVPPLLMVVTEGPTMILYVVFLYVAIQAIESYLLTPIIEQKTVSLPPALALSTQVLMGVLFGGLGVIFASPITAVGLKLVKMLYIGDLPGDTRAEAE